ncbi:MAG: TatD family hydrolase [Chlamydiales bacterium]|nr:TatD family hydrolase [Chlamydiales bacterium]
MYIDSHAHITSDELYPTVENILQRAKLADVQYILNICTDASTLQRGLEVHLRHPWVMNAGATTPHDVLTLGEKDFLLFEKSALSGKLVAVGETGLDYHYERSPKALQQEYLIRYFDLAKRANLPVVIHCRDAFEDLFSMADKYYRSNRAILHCFTGTLEEAKEVVKRGWKISFSGIVTFKKSEDLRRVFSEIPMSSILIETDAPYLAPGKYRGKINEPGYITETYRLIADRLSIDVGHLCNIVVNNFQSIITG